MRQPWELVADALRRAIMDRTYKPGDQLPSESQLAAQHHASRPTIRRALQDLRLKGLIETRQGKGAFVRRPPPLAITLTAENYNRHQREGRPGFQAQMSEQATPHTRTSLRLLPFQLHRRSPSVSASKKARTSSCGGYGSWSMNYPCSLSVSTTSRG